MFPFNLFKKKKKFENLPQETDLSQPTFQQPSFNEPQEDSSDLINSKLDTINAKLDNINMRLNKIEELASQ
tara:strand:+ start:683 stop:895 length:213 start_codon:yes stop_codon:yes gene_type:complete